jgi:hypothetical protein
MGVALIVTPLVWLIAEAISPALDGDAADQLGIIAAHPTRWYWYTMLLVMGSATGVVAAIGLTRVGAAGMARVGAIGGSLVTAGFLGGMIDSANQLWSWQMVATGADRAQMVALQEHFDEAVGTQIIFMVTGMGLLIGTVLLAVALARNPAVPTWTAVVFVVAVFVNIVAFSANSVAGVAASCALLLVSMGSIGVTMLRPQGSPVAVGAVQPAAG